VTTSLWQNETATERASFSVLEGDRDVDVLVVGAGLAGLSTARALRARGRVPLVVDRTAPGAGASARNAGFVLVTHGFGYPALRRRVGPIAARALLAMGRRTHEAIGGLLASTGSYRKTGSLVLSMDGDGDEASALEEARQVLEEDGIAAAFTEVPEGLAGFARALLLPDDAEVHPGRLIAALADGLDGAVARISRIDFRERVAHTEDSHRISYRDAVIATHAWAGELVPELATVIEPHRGQVLATAPLPRVLDRVCYAGWGYEYFRQREDGRVILGGRRGLFLEAEHTSSDAPTEPVQSALETYLAAHLPFARGATITDRWAGTMGFSPDLLPLVGALPGRPGAWVIAGFSGHGLGLGLACGEMLAARVAGDRPDESDVIAALLAPGRASGAFPRG